MDETRFETAPAAPAAAPAAEGGAISADSGALSAAPAQPLSGTERVELYDRVLEALRTCYDPEIPVNIYELGLIYEVKVEENGVVCVKMTLTTPNCPAAISLPGEVKYKIESLARVTEAQVEVVWEPPWEPSKMSEAARLQLGFL
jgi:FeS assembly SUF system protein